MCLNRSFLADCALAVSCLFVAIMPPLIFSYVFAAEGPVLLLSIWAGLCIACDVLVNILRRRSIGSRVLYRLLSGVVLLAVLCALLLVLLQLNVTKRSLAEAWLDLARQGQAFGFFSFFATELYSLFCLASALLLARRRFFLFAVAFLFAQCLSFGLIGNYWPLLLAAGALCVFFCIILLPISWFYCRGALIRSALFPLLLGIAFSTFLGFLTYTPASKSALFKTPDMSAIFASLAPAFPLLLDVPGYGYSLDVSEMKHTVYLTDRPLYAVQGPAETVWYLHQQQYASYYNGSWIIDSNLGEEVPVSIADTEYEREGTELSLYLLEDFYTSVPIARDTERIVLYAQDLPLWNASKNVGLLFRNGVKKGLVADLLPYKTSGMPDVHDRSTELNEAAGINDSEQLSHRYLELRLSENSRVRHLATELREKAETARLVAPATINGQLLSKDMAYLQEVLNWLQDGFVYSLRTELRSQGEQALEEFLFETKKGYCVWFASSCAILARLGGIPSRMVEGFRVELDDLGEGLLSGYNAHAWTEVYLDGAWRRLEPTPPYATELPFDWLDWSNPNSVRQLQNLFPQFAVEKTEETQKIPAIILHILRYLVLCLPYPGLFILFFVPAFIVIAPSSIRLRIYARCIVWLAETRGVSRPDKIGWVAWGQGASKVFPRLHLKELAYKMLEQSFSGP